MAFGSQGSVDPRTALAALMVRLDATDLGEQAGVRHGSRAGPPITPTIIAARQYAEHAAHHPDRPAANVSANEGEPHLGTSA